MTTGRGSGDCEGCLLQTSVEGLAWVSIEQLDGKSFESVSLGN